MRNIVLEDVKGETVTIDFESLITDFDEFAPKAEKVLDSVEWLVGTSPSAYSPKCLEEEISEVHIQHPA